MSQDNNIKTLRDTLGMSQEDFANRLGVNRSTVSSWEHGLTAPSKKFDDALNSLAEADIQDIPRKKKRSKWQNMSEEEMHRMLAANIKALSRTFTVGNCYTITESKMLTDGNILQHSILRYERKEGIHHVFREIRGKWIVTYTDAQLIDKYIKEVGNGTP